MTVGNLDFCLALYLTGVHFRDELQHVGHVGEQKIKYRPIRAREIAGVRLWDELYEPVDLIECPPNSNWSLYQYFSIIVWMIFNDFNGS